MPIEMMTVSPEEGNSIANYIIRMAKKQGFKSVAVSVFGSHKIRVSFMSMTGVMPASVSLADDKAYTALMTQRDTIVWHIRNNPGIIDDVYTEEWHRKNPPVDIRNFADAHFTFFPGGVILKWNDQIIGAIGVSGMDGGGVDHKLAESARTFFFERLL